MDHYTPGLVLLIKTSMACLGLIAVHVWASPGTTFEGESRDLHQQSFVFDAHVHMINRQLHHGGDIGKETSEGHADLPRLREGGVDAFFLTVFVPEEYYPARLETQHALRLLGLAHRQLEKNRTQIGLALKASDIDRINRDGKIAAVLDLEGGFDLGGDLNILRGFYAAGLRAAQLPAHNWGNEFADSCCADPKWGGLNKQGRKVVREMNRLGMVINVSHASDETLSQTIDLSTDPVIATHHGLRSVNDIPRNMPDDLLKKLAAGGGVIGFQIGNSFHNPAYFKWRTRQAGATFWDTSHVGQDLSRLSLNEIDRLVADRFPMVGPDAPKDLLLSVDDWVGVVDRAIELVGEDHVALGSDFDGGPTPPRGIRDARDLWLITDSMRRRGYSQERIQKFLGANLLRVFREVTER